MHGTECCLVTAGGSTVGKCLLQFGFTAEPLPGFTAGPIPSFTAGFIEEVMCNACKETQSQDCSSGSFVQAVAYNTSAWISFGPQKGMPCVSYHGASLVRHTGVIPSAGLSIGPVL